MVRKNGISKRHPQTTVTLTATALDRCESESKAERNPCQSNIASHRPSHLITHCPFTTPTKHEARNASRFNGIDVPSRLEEGYIEW